MTFSMSRTWSEAIGSVRENLGGLALITVGTYAIVAAALVPFFANWAEMMQPVDDPQLQLTRLNQMMSQTMGLSTLANLVQLASYAAMVSLLGPQRPDVGKALLDGLKATPTALISIAFLCVGFIAVYFVVAFAALLLIMPMAAAGAGSDSVNPATFGPIFLLVIVLYLGVLAAVLYLVARFAVLFPVIVLERQYNPFTVIGRTWNLTRGNGWKVVGFFVLLYVPVVVVFFALLMSFAGSLVTLDGQPPSLEGLVPFIVVVLAISIVLTMLLCAAVVSIHGQLATEAPTEA